MSLLVPESIGMEVLVINTMNCMTLSCLTIEVSKVLLHH